jgi:transposase
MIDADVRNAMVQLHLAGTSLRDISRQFHVSRNTVRQIIRQQGAVPRAARKDKIQIDLDLLRRLYDECEGWVRRVYEKLVEEENVQISYPTLTRLLRELDLGESPSARCDRVPDEPGVEMQHDTTVYQVKLSGQSTRVIASLLYLRYSKRRYLRFYRVFNRFAMKCFLHEALMHWGYAAKQCVIDNTNLARLRGTGKAAVIVPEMEVFGKRYGFCFLCHEIRHSNRKAGEERSFWTVETNFLKGRTFDSLEDLNRQAWEWATVRMYHRQSEKTGLIPAKAFEHERRYLTELSPHLPSPYRVHPRGTDQYGYVSFLANYYWVPGIKREDVKLLEYTDRLKIYQHHQCVAEYPLPADGIKNGRFSPEGQPEPKYAPRDRKQGSRLEEKRLRSLDVDVAAYVDYVLRTPGIKHHHFLRALWALSQRVPSAAFVQALRRALCYRVVQLETIERIAWLCLSHGEQPLPDPKVDEEFRQRPAYQEGYLTDEPDLTQYDPPSDSPEGSGEQDHEGDEDENG